MTRFERAVDAAIAQHNRDFLANPDAIREAQELGDRWRRQLERDSSSRQQVVTLLDAAEEARKLGMDPEKIRRTFRPGSQR